jgi:hypothetical protein
MNHTKARNKSTESVRLSIAATDFIRVMAVKNNKTFQEMASQIIREWAEIKVKK